MTVSVTARSDSGYLRHHGDDKHLEGPSEYLAGAKGHGDPPGYWFGEKAAEMGLVGEVKDEDLALLVDEFKRPDTLEELGSRPRKFPGEAARLSALQAANPEATPEELEVLKLEAHKSGRSNCHYYDFTYCIEKSVSVAHAALEHAGRQDEADAILDELRGAIEASLTVVDDMAYTRLGSGGQKVAGRVTTKYEKTPGLVTAIFFHRTSRDQDPLLHAHVMVLNRVQCADGKWRALHGQPYYKAKRMLDAGFRRMAEQGIERRIGLRFATREDGLVREVLGIGQDLRDLFSSRRRAVTPEVERLAAAYEERYGRPPSNFLKYKMSRFSTLKTRKAKPEVAPDRDSELTRWNEQVASQIRGGFDAVLAELDRLRGPKAAAVLDPNEVIIRAVASVEATKSVWTRGDLYSAIDAALPDDLELMSHEELLRLLDELTEAALGGRDVVSLVPPAFVDVPVELQREDGRSIFEAPDSERYATTRQLSIEGGLVDVLRDTHAPKVEANKLDAAIDPVFTLGADQDKVVRGLLSDGRRISVVVAAAGTGKTRALGAFQDAWKREVGGDVIGICTAQNAANVMKEEGFDRGLNAMLFLKMYARIDGNKKVSREVLEQYGIKKGSCLVIDEASMMDASMLADIVKVANRHGAKVVVTLDPAQLAAVGAGGAGSLLAEKAETYELTEVRRFAQPWEREASLGVREGLVPVLREYDRHGRIAGGTQDEMFDAAFDAYLADRLAGKRSAIIVGSNEDAAYLASRVHQALVELGVVGHEYVELRNEVRAGVGSRIATRLNQWRMPVPETTETFEVINRDTWVVTQVHGDGAIHAKLVMGRDRAGNEVFGPERYLPADYVGAHVDSADVVTKHAVQGRTLDTAHAVIDSMADRAGTYVSMTRGVESNHIWVVTQTDETYLERMVQVLANEQTAPAATQVVEEELARQEHLGHLGPQWSIVIADDTTARYDEMFRDVLGRHHARFVDDRSAPALYRLVRSAELRGAEPRQLIATAVTSRELDSAESVAEVLHSRVQKLNDKMRSNQREREFVRHSFVERTPTPAEPRMEYAYKIAEAMDRRALDLAEQAAAEPPAHLTALGPVPNEPTQRMEWIERAAAVEAYREQHAHYSPDDAIGRMPSWHEPERRVAWDQAADALRMDPNRRDLAEHDEGALRNLVAAYEREEAWMPRHVDKELQSASRAADEARRSAVRLEAGGAEPARVARAQETARRMEERRAAYEFAAEARDAAIAATEEKRQAHNAAKDELCHRGLIAQEEMPEPAPYVEPDDVQVATDVDRAAEALRRIDEIQRGREQAERARQEETYRDERERSAELDHEL